MPTLVLVRHGQSAWNAQNLFTGWKNPDLTETGIAEAHTAGTRLRAHEYLFDAAFTSMLTRAEHTLEIILNELGQSDIPTMKNEALNERDYGDLAGMNKDEARAKWGEEQVHIWRRSYDIAPPGGESLADTAARVLPYFENEIAPLLHAGLDVIVAAHGNSLRSLVMRLEHLTPDEIVRYEIATGVPLVYELDENGEVVKKDVLSK